MLRLSVTKKSTGTNLGVDFCSISLHSCPRRIKLTLRADDSILTDRKLIAKIEFPSLGAGECYNLPDFLEGNLLPRSLDGRRR
jgi:hypothetical protein